MCIALPYASACMKLASLLAAETSFVQSALQNATPQPPNDKSASCKQDTICPDKSIQCELVV